MKPFILLLIGSIVGAACGWIQVTSIDPRKNRIEVIGSDMDEAQEQEIAKSGSASDEIEQTGVMPSNLLPKVEVIGSTDFDFGTMKRGTSREHEFTFKNAGDAPLKLVVLDSTCKCTVGSVDDQYIPPGETRPVKLTWKAEGILPEFAQTATIGTTDPRMREVKLTITGRIGMNYVLEPDSLTLGEFSSRDTVERFFKLYSYEDTPLVCSGYWGDLDFSEKITVESEVEKLEIGSVPEHADARYVANYKLTIYPGMVSGPVNGQARLVVGPDEYPMSVPVTGRCVSDLRILAGPDYEEDMNIFNLGSYTSKEGGSKSLYISAISDQKDITLKVDRILPAEIADSIKITFGEPIVTPKKTLFPTTISIEPGTAPIDRDGSNPGNFGKVYFRSNIENSAEISMYLRFKVD